MTPERWEQVKNALADALARDPGDRAGYIQALAGEDADLARDVEGLLGHHVEGFLEEPAVPGGTPLAGTAFGPYVIESPIGEGGMGIVYLAQDRTLDRPVALKFLAAALERRKDARRRFLREARAAAALDHPYICKIYQTGEEQGRPFIAMEYVRGETLRRRLDAGPLPLHDALRMAVEVSEAIETAHAAHIVHRDLKPSNIMLTTAGHVKVLDFGLAKHVGGAVIDHAETRSELTEAGEVQGTVAYMSPEQVRGQEADFRSDIFSLGVVLYESLTGRNPFQAGSSLETGSQILHHTPPAIGLIRGGVPAALERVVHTMLAKAPDNRYRSTGDLRQDLARVRDLVDRGDLHAETRTTTSPTVTGRPWGRAITRRRAIAGALIVAVAALAGTAGWRWRAQTRSAAGSGPLSVAVLPFANISGDPGNDYLANGIAQAVTTRLHRAGLRVIPWETARRFRDSRNPIEIARTLRVAAVLSGSFQTSGDRLLVTVSLTEGASGFVSWTDEIKDSVDDIFQVQTRIAQGVARSLGHEVTVERAARLGQAESSSPDAYDFYLQGAEHLLGGDRESTNIAFEFFSRAVEIDRNLAEAHIGLGAVYLERHFNGWGGSVRALELAAKSFEAALHQDAGNIRAKRGLVLTEWYRGSREEGVLAFARDTAKVASDDIETLLARAEAYTWGGLPDPALPLLERVLMLDPGNQTASWLLTIANYNTGRFEKAAAAADDYARRFDNPAVHLYGAVAREQLGDVAGSRDRFARLTDPLMQSPVETGSATWFDVSALFLEGVLHDNTGRNERAQELWQKGLQLTRESLATNPDSVGMRLFLASFLGVLGDRDAFSRAEASARALIEASELDPDPFELTYLVGAHAHLGDAEGALDILRSSLARRGIVPPLVAVAAPSLRGTSGLDQLLREAAVVEQRRRRLYAAP
jgi:serine/threonine protein kinase/TolB-like protein/tetratricopeptide (TPR) repeat protein